MPNINAFEQVVHEKKIFKDVTFSPFFGHLNGPLTNLNPHSLEILPTKFG